MAGTFVEYKVKRGRKVDENRPTKPKKLSKAGEWRRANPGPLFEILDMRAVLK